MEVVRIPLAEARRYGGREVNAATVAMLKESLAAVGLLSPIVVRKPTMRRDGPSEIECYWIIAGKHRVEAASQLGWTEIDAVVLDGSVGFQELAEIDENLVRAELTDVQRARALSRRKELMEELGLVCMNGGDRKSDSQNAKLKSFADNTAESVGVHRATVYRDLARAKEIEPDVLDAIEGTPVDKGVHLDAIAKTPRPEQMAKAKEIAESFKEGAAANRAADRAITDLAAEQWAEWIMARADLGEMDSIIAMIEAAKPSRTIAALRRLCA